MSEETERDEFSRPPQYVQPHTGFSLVKQLERERRALARTPNPTTDRTPR